MTKRILHYLFYLYLFLNTFSVFAQVNVDTPNLSFGLNNFSGWELYTGEYFYFDNTTNPIGGYPTTPPYTSAVLNQYNYIWTQIPSLSPGTRFEIMGTMSGTNDPIVSCSNFFINPPGMPRVARIGAHSPPGTTIGAEGNVNPSGQCNIRNNWTTGKYATSEKMTYTFTVTPNSALLVYRFAAVLRDPQSGGVHTGDEIPSYLLSIKVDDGSYLACNSFEGKGDIEASGFERNRPTTGVNACPSGGGNEYVFKNWTTGMIDLFPHIGKSVTIEIITHDCIVQCPLSGRTYRVAGAHEAYGYFWAETMGLKLEPKNCVGDDAYITATNTGFLTYRWYRSDNKPVETVPGQPNVARIPQTLLDPGVTYYCEMTSDMGCPPITLATQLPKIVINPDFKVTQDCSGKVYFTNQSTIESDTIQGYVWDFGDGAISYEKNPTHTYAQSGEKTVTLKVISSFGCETTIVRPVAVRYFPDLQIVGEDAVCAGDRIILTVYGAEIGSSFLWDNGATDPILTDNAVTSKYYEVKVTDPHTCEYTKRIYISVKQNPMVIIDPPYAETCLNNTATLTARGGDETLSYLWNHGVTTAATTVRPLADETFTVTGTASNGCKSTASRLVKVNPLPDVYITGPDEICRNTTAGLVAHGANSYLWGDGITTGTTLNVTPLNDTTCTVMGTDINGCRSSASKSIQVKDNPILSFSGDTVVCAGDMVRLIAHGASSYVWHNGSTDEVFTEIPANNTTYWFEGTTNGCTTRKYIQIRVLARPILFVDGSRTICENDTLRLKANGADRYAWSTGATTDTMQSTPSASTTYQVQGSFNNGCSSVLDVPVTVRPNPGIMISGPLSTCENTQVTLEAQGSVLTWSWSPTGQISASITPNITSTTTFTATGTDVFGCRGKASHTVTAIPPPTLSINGDTEVCLGDLLTIAAQGAATYVWHDGSTSAVYSAAPTANTVYSVTGTLSGCTSSINVPIEVKPLPNVWIDGNTNLCQGDTVRLQANGAATYLWNTGATTAAMQNIPSSSTSYQVQGFGSNGCTKVVSINVTLNPLPDVSITGPTSACENSLITLIAQGDNISSYTWSNNIIASSIEPLIAPGNQTFTVRGTDANGCIGRASHVVTGLPFPALTFTGPTEVCKGQSITLAVEGATSYLWHDGATSGVYTNTPTNNTVYTVTGTLNGCSTDLSIPITVLTPPTIWIDGRTEICEGEQVRLTGRGGVSYRWSTGETTNYIDITPSYSTTYQVQGFDASGCNAFYSVDVTVRPKPFISITGPATACENSSVTLTAQGAITYQWDNGDMSPSTSPLIAAGSQTFTVDGTDALGCVGRATHTVNGFPLPVLSYLGENSVCNGQRVTLAAQGASSYVWHDGTSTAVFSDLPTGNTVYRVTGTSNGCSSSLNIPIEVKPVPSVWVEGKTEVCPGELVRLEGKGASSYEWSTGATTNFMEDTPTTTTTYQVKGIGANGCATTVPVTVNVRQRPTLTITGNNDVCLGASTTLTAFGSDIISYRWDDLTTNPTINPTINTSTATFSVEGTDGYGCTNTANYTVNTRPLPTLSYIGSDEVCIGLPLVLAAQGANTYVWHDGSTSPVYTGIPTGNTIYSVTGTLNGCSSTLYIPIRVLLNPTVWVDGKTDICPGEQVHLQANGAVSYEWSTGAVTSAINVTPTNNTSYEVRGTGANGCVASVITPVVIRQLPAITITGDKDVCDGGTATLTASGGVSYVWNNGKTDAVIYPEITANTTYTVEGTDLQGCKNSASYTVDVRPLPALSYTGNTSVCEGQSLTLIAQGATSYEWHDGSTSAVYTNTPTTNTTYSVTGTINGCSTRLDIPVQLLALPNVWIDGNTGICLGDTVRLQAKGAVTYSWNTGETTDVKEAVPATPAAYQVIGTGANGCVRSASVNVTISPKPNVTITGPISTCENTTVTLTAGGDAGVSYQWSDGTTGNTITPTINATRSYTLSGTGSNGCVAKATHTVAATPLPELTYTGNTTVCSGRSVTLAVQGAASYVWQDGSTLGVYTVTPTNNTTYTVTGTLNGCSSTLDIPVTVAVLPTVWIDGPTEICTGQTLQLEAKGAVSYYWNTGANTAILTAMPLANTTYQVQGTDANGCTTTVSVNVIVRQSPAITITGTPSVCEGETVTLTAQGPVSNFIWEDGTSLPTITPTIAVGNQTFTVYGSDGIGCAGQASYTVTGIQRPVLTYQGNTTPCEGQPATITMQGATSYEWQDGTTGGVYIKTPTSNTTYTVTGTLNGCTSTLDIPVQLLTLPNVWIDGNTDICLGDTVRLQAKGAVTYSWNTGETTDIVVAAPTTPATYQVVGTGANGCVRTASVNVSILPKPDVTITGPVNACENSSVTLTAGGDAGVSYQWNDGTTGNTFTSTITATKSYTLNGTGSNGCVTKATHTVTAIPLPELTYSGSTTVCLGRSVTLAVQGAASYVWQDGSTSGVYTVTPTGNTTYTVTGTLNGCSSTINIPVTVITLPSVWIDGPTEICAGQTVRLEAKGANTYYWNTGDNTAVMTATPLTNTTYQVQGTDANGCTTTVSVNVIVRPAPVITITGTPSVCEDDVVTLTAQGPVSNFEWEDGTPSPSITPTIVAGNQTFTVHGWDGLGCTGQASYTVTGIQRPVLTFQGNTTPCEGQSITLTVQGATSYEWQDGATGGVYTKTPVASTTYSVTGTSNGCTSKLDIPIQVLPLPNIWIDGNTTVCSGDKVNLQAQGAWTYQWNTGAITSTIEEIPTASATYQVQGTALNGCRNTASVNVTIIPKPYANITGPNRVCENTEITLSVDSDADSYLWNDGTDQITMTSRITATRTFTVDAIGSNGCINRASHTVTAVPLPVISYTGNTNICQGQSVILAAQGASDYVWQNGSTDRIFTDFPARDTTYSVTGEMNGCFASINIPVYVSPIPSIWVEGKTEICAGETVQLEAKGATSFSWSTGVGTAVMTDMPLADKTYQVQGTGPNGCAATLSVNVIVRPKPTVQITGNNNACEGSSVTLTASGDAVSYIWNDGITVPVIQPVITARTTFTVEGTDVYGCKNTATHTVDSRPLPELSYTGNNTACEGQPVTLAMQGAISYLWHDGSTERTYTQIPTQDAIYTVTGTLNGCSATLEIPISIFSVPTLIVSGKTEICAGEVLQLQAQGALTYHWNTGATTAAITDSPLTSTTYQVHGTAANGCVSSLSTPVTVHPKPQLQISGDRDVCQDSYATLTVSGNAHSYVWSDGTSSLVINPLISSDTTFTVEGTSIYECKNTASYTVKSRPLPVITYTGRTIVCEGQAVNLSLQGATSYLWHDGSTGSAFSRIPVSDTTYSVVGTLNNCKDSIEIPIQVRAAPYVWVDGVKRICLGDVVQLQAKGADTYRWSTGALTDVMSDTPFGNMTYQVQGTDIYGCSSTVLTPVTVLPKPTIAISGSTSVCENSYTTLTASGSAVSYLWDDGSTYPSISPLVAERTTYTVEGTDSEGCKNQVSHTVNVRLLPVLSYQGKTNICEGETINLSVHGATTYVWHDGSTSSTFTHTPAADTTYTVTGMLNNCTAELDIPVSVASIPLVWTIGETTICPGDTARLQAKGADTYRWSTGALTDEMKDAPPNTMTYYVWGTGPNGCTGAASTTVTVRPRPAVQIAGPDEVCENSRATLTASGDAISYLWSEGSYNNLINPVVTTTTVYSVTGSDSYGCKNTASHTVRTRPVPTLVLQGKTDICKGEGVNFVVYGADSYLWHDGSTSNTFNHTPSSDIVYSVTGTVNGCVTKRDIPVQVFPLPFVWTTGSTTSCDRDTVLLYAHGAKTYQWSNGTIADVLVVAPQTSTTYQLQGTDENGCRNTISIDVTVFAKPNITVTGEEEVCGNTTVTLTASGNADVYYWDNGYVGRTIQPFVEKTTVFTVRGVNSDGCSSTVSHTVNAITLPGLTYTGNTSICLGDMLSLIAQGAAHYKWQDGTTSPMYDRYPISSGQLMLTGTTGNCSSTITIPITVLIPPNLYVSDDIEVCKNSLFTLWATGADFYEWSTGDSTAIITYPATESATYYVRGRNVNGCTATGKADVKMLPLPNIKITQEDMFGCPETQDTVILSASGAVKYQWSSIPYNWNVNEKTGERIRFEIEEETLVFVEGEGENGCIASDSMVVRRLEYLPFVFAVQPNVIEAGSSAVRFNGISPDDDHQWFWTAGDGSAEQEGRQITHGYSSLAVDSFLVSVRSVSEHGCEYAGEEWVYVWRDFWAPDAFTPNSDKLNDVFRFIGNEKYITEFSFIIFNRLGEVVFTGHSLDDEWDGTYKGQLCPWGVYGWVVNYKSNYKGLHKGGERKGVVTLIR